MTKESQRDIIKVLIGLSKEQRESLWASVEVCCDVVGPPQKRGRPRGSPNKKKPEEKPQPALPLATASQ